MRPYHEFGKEILCVVTVIIFLTKHLTDRRELLQVTVPLDAKELRILRISLLRCD